MCPPPPTTAPSLLAALPIAPETIAEDVIASRPDWPEAFYAAGLVEQAEFQVRCAGKQLH